MLFIIGTIVVFAVFGLMGGSMSGSAKYECLSCSHTFDDSEVLYHQENDCDDDDDDDRNSVEKVCPSCYSDDLHYI